MKNFILLILLILLITHIIIECSICNEKKIKYNVDNNLNDILASIPDLYDLKINGEFYTINSINSVNSINSMNSMNSINSINYMNSINSISSMNTICYVA